MMFVMTLADNDAGIPRAPSSSMALPPNNNIIGLALMEQGGDHQNNGEGDLSLLGSETIEKSGGTYDNPLSCFGCGIGWFSFILGFVFPPLWFYATALYFGNYYLKDPRERPGLAASAIAALFCLVGVLISLLVVFS